MRMGHSIKLGRGRRRGSGRSRWEQPVGWLVQVWAGSTRTANTLPLCAVRGLKKSSRSRSRSCSWSWSREATASTCILAKGNGAHESSWTRTRTWAAFKVRTSLSCLDLRIRQADAMRDSQMEALAKPLHASQGDKTAKKKTEQKKLN